MVLLKYSVLRTAANYNMHMIMVLLMLMFIMTVMLMVMLIGIIVLILMNVLISTLIRLYRNCNRCIKPHDLPSRCIEINKDKNHKDNNKNKDKNKDNDNDKKINTILRRSVRLANKHIHPYVLCIIDMQPEGFSNAKIIIDKVLELVRQAIQEQAFIVIAQYKNDGDTHKDIRNALINYPYKAYGWHNKNDKSVLIWTLLKEHKVFTREIHVCGINTEYCVLETVNGLAQKFHIPIKVIEKACNGCDSDIGIEKALQHMRTGYINVTVE